MKTKPSKQRFPSELRFDLVSKDWVVIATGRAKRPETFKKTKRVIVEVSEGDCPFCQIETQEKPVLVFAKGKKVSLATGIPKNWTTIVISNKFPAFTKSEFLKERVEGPYQIMDGVGFHEVVVTREHKKHLADFSIAKIKEVIDVYQERYLALMKEKFVKYVAIFHNHGSEAGASVFHPHSQIIALAVIDPDLQSSLKGSKEFFGSQGKCVHCLMNNWDIKDGQRIVFKNKGFVVLCPFASRVAFEVRIYPLEHEAHFETIAEDQKWQLAEALKTALKKLKIGLGDPAYNFFLHTAPCAVSGDENYDHYHWHLEILPKTSTWAGFELGTGIEISTVQPEKAAEYLRKQ